MEVKVTAVKNGESSIKEYRIVGSNEANPKAGRISDELTKKLNLLQDLKKNIDNSFYKKIDIKIEELTDSIEYWKLSEIKMEEYMAFE